MRKYGQKKRGYFCTNCRAAWDPDNGDPPVVGCLLDNDAMRLGRARLHDLDVQERRLLRAQAERERLEDIAAGAMTPDGQVLLE